MLTDIYPNTAAERDRWILAQRAARTRVDPQRPSGFLIEEERAESAEIVQVATIFLTNRECPWRCLMCDLWKNTLTETVPVGAIPAQVDRALSNLRGRACESTADTSPVSGAHRVPDSSSGLTSAATRIRQIKLYNSGSFFDPRAIPVEDYSAIAERVRGFERVIVECHPALVGQPCLKFRDLLGGTVCSRPTSFARDFRDGDMPSLPAGKLEVAMGLETAHPEVLEKLNKRMSLDDFKRAADFLRAHEIAFRAFVLVKPPFLDEDGALEWAKRSVDFAFDCGATAVSLIPTRLGNGSLEALAERGDFSPPKLATLEAALAYGIGLKRGRVFADLWDLERFGNCAVCFEARRQRLRQMNLNQTLLPAVGCDRCGDKGLRVRLSSWSG